MQSTGNPVSARNQRFAVEINTQKRTLALTDQSLKTRWSSASPFLRVRIPRPPEEERPYWGFPDPSEEVEWKPEQLAATASGTSVRLRLSGLHVGKALVGIDLAIQLERERVRFEVSEVSGLPAGKELIVDFPYRLGAAKAGDDGALILPRGAGILVDFARTRESYPFENFIYSGGQNGFSLPIYGTVRGKHVLAAIIKTPFDCLLSGEINSGTPAAYAASPCWLFEGGRLMEPRRVDYSVFRGSYGELARWYRSDLIVAGRYKTLNEKAEGHPLVHTLPGAVLAEMRLDFKGGRKGKGPTPYELADKAHAMGFDRLVAYSVGVWQRPFFGTHAVPPEEGAEEDLARAARYARTKSKTYYITVYENLIDMWPHTPGYDVAIMAKRRDGSVRPNWYSKELGSRSSTVCSVHRLETVQRDLPGLRDLIGQGSIYMDVEGAMEINECFDPVHPLTREQDAGYRRELLRATKDLFGTVATESVPMDCLADVVDVGAYFPIYQFIGYGCSDKPKIVPPVVPIPLYPMVYHGSVLHMTPRANDFYTCDPLYVPLWGMMPEEVDEFSLRISKNLRETSYATMEEHRFLTGPSIDTSEKYHSTDVQFSRFSDGVCVLANFSPEEFSWEGKTAPAKDYAIWKE